MCHTGNLEDVKLNDMSLAHAVLNLKACKQCLNLRCNWCGLKKTYTVQLSGRTTDCTLCNVFVFYCLLLCKCILYRFCSRSGTPLCLSCFLKTLLNRYFDLVNTRVIISLTKSSIYVPVIFMPCSMSLFPLTLVLNPCLCLC